MEVITKVLIPFVLDIILDLCISHIDKILLRAKI